MKFTATEGAEMNVTATMARLYNIYDALRTARPDTYGDDFRLVLDTFSTNGPAAANALVRVLLDEA